MAEDNGPGTHEDQSKERIQQPVTQIGPALDQPLTLTGESRYPTSLLNDPRLKQSANQPVRVALMQQAQQTYGNRALRRMLQSKSAANTANSVVPVSPQPTISPLTGGIFIQRLKTGSDENTKKNIAKAKKELKEITDPSEVSDACVELEKIEPGVLARYKTEYLDDYLPNLGKQLMFQWPLSYLRGRAARKLGKSTEDKWIKAAYGDEVTKNNQAFTVENDEGEYEQWIPDVATDSVVADVKNVATQSFSEQLRAFYAIAKHKDPLTDEARKIYEGGTRVPKSKVRRFELIVRSARHPAGTTDVSGPLVDATDRIRRIITA